MLVPERPVEVRTAAPIRRRTVPNGSAAKRPLVVIGSGDAATSAYTILTAADRDGSRWQFVGFLDEVDAASAFPSTAPVGWIGRVRSLLDLDPDACFVVATRTPASRRIVASWATSRGRSAAGLVHPSADLDPSATVGLGAVIDQGVTIAAGARLDDFVHVATQTDIGSASVGAFASIGSRVRIADDVEIGDEVLIGDHVDVAPGVTIGARAVIHPHSRVVADVEPDQLVRADTLLAV